MLKKILYPTLIFTLLLACKHDPVQPNGSICQLVKLTRPGSTLTTENVLQFEYDAAGNLIRQNEFFDDSLWHWTILNYDNGRLLAREYWDNYKQIPTLNSKDSLIYNSLGQISEVWIFWPTNATTPHYKDFYEYDAQGLPVKTRYFSSTSNKVLLSYRYFWENGNITKVEDYAGDFGALQHEWFYEYSDVLNYQRILKLTPEYPQYLTQNMVSRSSAKDYTGLLDLICDPCQTSFWANNDHYPERIKYGWGETEVLVWDCH